MTALYLGNRLVEFILWNALIKDKLKFIIDSLLDRLAICSDIGNQNEPKQARPAVALDKCAGLQRLPGVQQLSRQAA